MLCGPGLWFDELSDGTAFISDLRAGPPHGFGKHIDQVSAQDFETFEVVWKTPRQPSNRAVQS